MNGLLHLGHAFSLSKVSALLELRLRIAEECVAVQLSALEKPVSFSGQPTSWALQLLALTCSALFLASVARQATALTNPSLPAPGVRYRLSLCPPKLH